jgi:protein-S-isoprenylcysteine O-methyltransferase Ste14
MSQGITTLFPHRVGAVMFIIAFIVWAAFEAFNTIGLRLFRRTAIRQRKDQGSYWVIFLVVWGSMFISFLLRAIDWGIFHNNLQFLGIGMIFVGIAFREWAVFSLGRFFTVAVTVASDQTLVKHGPYRWLRHPAYSGSILSLVGFPLAIGTWAGGLAVFIFSLVGYFYRVQIEEKALLNVFGEEYREYMQRTWRLFPGI